MYLNTAQGEVINPSRILSPAEKEDKIEESSEWVMCSDISAKDYMKQNCHAIHVLVNRITSTISIGLNAFHY